MPPICQPHDPGVTFLAMATERYRSFAEFWPYYLGEHAHGATRLFHFVGTSVGAALFVFAAVTRSWAFLPVALVVSYGLAWVSHFTIEKNRPATFTYPVWSFLGDWKMLFLAITGRLQGELARLGIGSKA